jgi:hypothetical protein
MTESPDPQIAALVAAYARDLTRCEPSSDLDARIEQLVAAPRQHFARTPRRRARTWLPRPTYRVATWATAAGLVTLAVATGIIIGVSVERAGAPPPAITQGSEPSWPPTDFTMWPTDSVPLKVAARKAGTRYWVDIVVSNDGTVRIENIVPAGEEKHGISTQTP